MTFDENILWRDTDVSLRSAVYGEELLAEGQVLLEVKTAGAISYRLTKLLSKEHIYRTNFSKYGTAYRTMYEGKQTNHANILENGGIYQYA